MDNALAIILAGGRGKRMDILCRGRPKPALPFAGTYRVIDFVLSNCIHSRISDIAVMVDYQRSRMAEYLRQWCLVNGDFSNFRTLEPRAGSYLGTADAVYRNLDFLKKQKTDTVLILAGDHVYKMDYRHMLSFHERCKADVTVGVISVPIEQAHRFGIVAANNEGRIVDFVEKPRIPRSNLVSMGIYVFDKQVLIERLVEDAAKPNSPHDFGYAVIPAMINRDRAYAYQFAGYWQDIGTKEAYYEANMELIRQQPSFSLDSGWPILTEKDVLRETQKSEQGTIKDSLVSPGCVIKGEVENCVLSPGVRVDEQAVVRNSVLMAGVSIGYHSVVDRCILDEGVRIGKFCYIGFGSSLLSGDWEVTVLGKGVTVPPHTAIGRNCRILPHAGPADFTANTVPSGAVVSPRSALRSAAVQPKKGGDEKADT